MNGSSKKFPLKSHLRRYYLKRCYKSLCWTWFFLAAWLVAVEYFYGPGQGLTDRYPYLLGGLCALGLVGLLVSFGYSVARLVSLMTCTGSLKRSMNRYLPHAPVQDPYEVLDGDIRCRLFEIADIYLGCDWIVFPGQAMKRDAVADILLERLSDRYLSKKCRIHVKDSRGNGMYQDLAPSQESEYVYHYLAGLHPAAGRGDYQARQGLGAISAYQEKVQKQQEEDMKGSTSLGISAWDRSPVLEDNHIRSQYERWLLASYSLYLAADPQYHADFACTGGYERTVYQRDNARKLLEDPWEIHNRKELLDTVHHLVRTGQDRHSGWQLGRAPMVLGFAYIAEMITREELLEYSLEAALAIQQTFSTWQELMESYLEGYAAWARRRKHIAHRRRVLRELLGDPQSLINTVPIQADLNALYQEAT